MEKVETKIKKTEKTEKTTPDVSSQKELEKKVALKKPLLALFFYADNDYRVFMKFQHEYLDNCVVKFFFAKKLLRTLSEWMDENDLQTEESPIQEIKEEKTRAELRSTFEQCGYPFDKFDCTPTPTLQEYMKDMDEEVGELVGDFSVHFRPDRDDLTFKDYLSRHSLTVTNRETKQDKTYEILIYARYTGIIMIKTVFGDNQPILFCHGNSRKYEIPCAVDEFLMQKDEKKLLEYVDPSQKKSSSKKRSKKMDQVDYSDCKPFAVGVIDWGAYRKESTWVKDNEHSLNFYVSRIKQLEDEEKSQPNEQAEESEQRIGQKRKAGVPIDLLRDKKPLVNEHKRISKNLQQGEVASLKKEMEKDRLEKSISWIDNLVALQTFLDVSDVNKTKYDSFFTAMDKCDQFNQTRSGMCTIL